MGASGETSGESKSDSDGDIEIAEKEHKIIGKLRPERTSKKVGARHPKTPRKKAGGNKGDM